MEKQKAFGLFGKGHGIIMEDCQTGTRSIHIPSQNLYSVPNFGSILFVPDIGSRK